jgi:hypothetical protein
MVIGLLVGGSHGARKVLHHIRSQRKTLPHRETLLRIRILAVGAWLLFFAGESWWFRDISSWHIILPLALAYSVFGGIFLHKAGILWREGLIVLICVFFTSLLAVAVLSGLVVGVVDGITEGVWVSMFGAAMMGLVILCVWGQMIEDPLPT